MEDNNARRVLFIVAIILVCISVGGTIAGVAGSYWFTTDKQYFGLLTNCRTNMDNTDKCETRDNILKFSNNGKRLKSLELEKGSTCKKINFAIKSKLKGYYTVVLMENIIPP